MRVLIRGAGDLASGIALRLFHAKMEVIMTDLPRPTAIRRTVCFSQAILFGTMTVGTSPTVRLLFHSDSCSRSNLYPTGMTLMNMGR